MTSRIIPVLKIMSDIYALPKADRFPMYLHHLKGTSESDIELPISGYNPMAESEVAELVKELIDVKLEGQLTIALQKLHGDAPLPTELGFALNVIDDVFGSWSHKSVVDYTYKFQNQALLKRGFSIISVYVSEEINLDLINERLCASYYRAEFQLDHGLPVSLFEHVEQELYVRKKTNLSYEIKYDWKEKDVAIIKEYARSEDYNLNFNYWYGNKVSDELGYPKPLREF